MSVNDIPDECINDPQFVQILTATLVSEYETNEKMLKDFVRGIKILKVTVTKEVEERKNVKQQINENKERKRLMEPLLEHMSRNECKRMTELNLLKKRLDEVSLRKQIIKAKYRKILDTYRETWNKYEAEYEEFELAVIRKQSRMELERLKIQYMVKQYKKLEYHNMLKQREIIDGKRIQSVIVKSSKMMLDLWQKQKYANTLKNNIISDQKKFEIVIQEYNQLQRHLETEAETKALARQQMPFPKLNISLVRSLYVDRSSHSQRIKEHKYQPKRTTDPDTISVNTIMFEEMCSNDENIEANTTCGNHEHEENEDNRLSSSFQQDVHPGIVTNDTDKAVGESNIMTLENICSQLSIHGETCDDNSHETVENRRQPTSQSYQKSQELQEQTENITNPLKHKSSTTELLYVKEDEQLRKKCKLAEPSAISQKNLGDETYVAAMTSGVSAMDKLTEATTTDSLPQIKKIEKITRPITVQIKPPMAEVPPTPSSLFSPRHYVPSYASSENLSHYFDNNYIDPTQDICGLDNYSENWQNLSPPQAGSEISFASAHVPVKNIISNNNEVNFMNKPEKPASNFLNFFNSGTTNPKSLF